MLVISSIITPLADSKRAIAKTGGYDSNIDHITDLILSMQLDSNDIAINGAIKTGPNYTKYINGDEYYIVEPYFNNLALLSLLEDPNDRIINTTKKWIDWYLNNLNMPDYNNIYGSIYIHYIEKNNPNHIVTEGSYDSVDSYASTFLMVLNEYHKITGDTQFLIDNEYKITLIENAMLSSIDTDGLSGSKPDYNIKFLMDNSEIYAGLGSLIELFGPNGLNKPAPVEIYKIKKAELASSIENILYNPATKLYYPYKGATSTDMNVFYPDATSQLFPIRFGLVDPRSDRAKEIIENFESFMPEWYNLDYDTYPWMLISQTYYMMGDYSHLKTSIDNFLEKVEANYQYSGNIIHESAVCVYLMKHINKISPETIPDPAPGEIVGLDDIRVPNTGYYLNN